VHAQRLLAARAASLEHVQPHACDDRLSHPPRFSIALATLAAFKYLVENGEPPMTKHAKLPRAATAC